jgi:hypothetical protein
MNKEEHIKLLEVLGFTNVHATESKTLFGETDWEISFGHKKNRYLIYGISLENLISKHSILSRELIIEISK